MLRFSFDVIGADKVEVEMADLGGSDFTGLWPLFRDELFAIEAEQFGSQGAHGLHGEWEENEPRYAAWKERKRSNWIERLSGRLYYSLTGETEDGVFTSTPEAMTFGTAAPYGLFQQTGFKTRLGNVAADWYAEKAKKIGFANARRIYGPIEAGELGAGEARHLGHSILSGM